MKMVGYILAGLVVLVLLVYVIGLILPKERIETRQSVINAPPEELYSIVVNNEDWQYRSDLKDLKIINREGEMEVWDEVSTDGNVIRFATRDKIPYSFYSFDMESKVMTGYWIAEFTEIEDGKTCFTATEYIKMKNPLLRVLSYLFFDIGEFMETYQADLKKRVED